MTDWNFATVYEAIAAAVPDRPCLVHGGHEVTWSEVDARSSALATDLTAAGLTTQSKVALYLHNGPEYLEGVLAAFKGRFAPVNTNFRYGPTEIRYLFENADAEAVVFHASFGELLDGIRRDLPLVKRWYVVSDETGTGPDWATPYEAVVTSGRAAPTVERSGDDLLLLYTGGTTGMPKGVMWRQDDLINLIAAGGNPLFGIPAVTSVDQLVSAALANDRPPVTVVCCPLMHGTGWFSALVAMIAGGTVVTLANRRFDVADLFQTIERRRATNLVIVGQPFSGPMLDHLDAHEGRYDLSSVASITSSGVMWSLANKQGLLRHMPQVMLVDSFGSSEAIGVGLSVSTIDHAEDTARFTSTVNSAVFTDDGRRVEPGSDEMGMVAVGGFIPVGYYKDEAKSAATFRTIEGRRWSVPGDFATVDADGTIRLLGRGSVCINTGGEKVFPEEVEEALKTHPTVRDAVVVGIPDERFGETICGVIEPIDGAVIDRAELLAHVAAQLAAYKVPRNVVIVSSIDRAANGKVDYQRLKMVAAGRLAER